MPEQHQRSIPRSVAIRIAALLISLAVGIGLYLSILAPPRLRAQAQFNTSSTQPRLISAALLQQSEVGRDCMRGCHNAIVESFVMETHGKSAKFLKDARAANCTVCHGNAEKHADTSSPTRNGGDVINPAKVSASLASESCLQCHSRDRYLTDWRGGKHDRSDMSCVSCHSVHHTKFSGVIAAGRQRAFQEQAAGLMDVKSSDAMLASLTIEETCFRCHSDKRKALYQRSTHLLRTENQVMKLTCVSCHSPHGGGRKMLQESSVNKVCYGCHAEKRGPFLWEHDPVQEDCLTCHTPHGSNNIRLLTKRSHQLCQQCHVNMLPRHSTVAGFDVFTFNRGCVNCHSQIHGSNHPSGRTFTR